MSSAAGHLAWSSASCDASIVAAGRSSYDRWSASLYRYFAVRSGGDMHLADDLMQKLWVQSRAFVDEHLTEPEEAWLRKVAMNLLRTHWRRSRRRPGEPLADPRVATALAEQMDRGPLPEAILAQREALRDQLLLALTELPGDEQDLLVAHYFDGLAHAQLAQRWGLSERAIEGRLYRARQTLRERLRCLGDT